MPTLPEIISSLETLVGAIEKIAFGGDTENVTLNGTTRPSVSKSLADRFNALQAMVQGRLTFETKAQLDAHTPTADANGQYPLAEVWGDTDENNGLYGYSGSAWVGNGYDPRTYTDKSLEGIEKSATLKFPAISDANGVELLGFDDDGRAIMRFSPTVVPDLVSALGSYLTTPDSEDFPSIRDANGLELLGFDATGAVRFVVSSDVANQIAKKINYDPASEYDPVAGGLLPSDSILLLGDSMSTPTITTAISTALGGRPVSLLQKGGQDAYALAVIMGVIPLTVTISGNEIPASGGISVTSKSTNILFTGGTYTGTANVTIAGVPGVMSTDSSGNWTFTRSTDGTAITTTEDEPCVLNAETGTSFIPATSAYIGRTVVIWLGRNGARSTRSDRVARTLEPLRKIAEALTPVCRRLVFITPYNQQSAYEASGTSGYDLIMTLGEEMHRELGPFVLDMRSAAVKNAIYDIGDTPDANDLSDIAADCIPTRYFSDSTHVNATLQAWEGEFIGNYLRTIGY